MKASELQKPNSLSCLFLVCCVILMVHADFQDGSQTVVDSQIACLFFRSYLSKIAQLYI